MHWWLAQKSAGGLAGSHGGDALLVCPQPVGPFWLVSGAFVSLVSGGGVFVWVASGGEVGAVACEAPVERVVPVEAQPAAVRHTSASSTTVQRANPTLPLSTIWARDASP